MNPADDRMDYADVALFPAEGVALRVRGAIFPVRSPLGAPFLTCDRAIGPMFV